MDPSDKITLVNAIHRFTENQVLCYKEQYIEGLSNVANDNELYSLADLRALLRPLHIETLQELYQSLKDIFTPQCSCSVRSKIIQCLLRTSQDQWPEILKQVCFIMPIGSRGHDVMRVTEILTSVQDLSYRTRLVITANRMFTPDMNSLERTYILATLAALNSGQLSHIDREDEVGRAAWIKTVVPEATNENHKPDLLLLKVLMGSKL